MKKSIVLIQAGSPPNEIREALGDYPLWFCNLLNMSIDDVEVVRVFAGQTLPAPDPSRVAIISGSWAMVTDRLPWSESTARWIRDAMRVDMPLFGVCYGHQLMAHALGGVVDYHPAGREVGCQQIWLLECAANDPLLTGMPSRFAAHLTHEQAIVKLPEGAQVLASSSHDPHQIVRYGPKAISVQFHPEFSTEICTAIIRFHAESLRMEGQDPQAFLSQVQPTPDATALLSHFVAQMLERQKPSIKAAC